MRSKVRASLLAVVLAGSACPAVAGSVTVAKAWFRALPAGLPAAGYFSLHNGGASPVVLASAQTPACSMLMLHLSTDTGGMSRMNDVQAVTVPAGGTIDFAPGGYHLMCMGATPAMTPGGAVSVTLGFADGSKVTTPFPVKTAAGK
jgi:copper(I)-binding protein